MLNVVLVIIAIFVVFILYPFVRDMKGKENELKKQGGIKNKYRELIGYFYGFDTNILPTILQDKPNFYQIGWAEARIVVNVTFFEIGENINIQLNVDYNRKKLDSMGIDVRELPPVRKEKYWKYNTLMNQREIAVDVLREIQKELGR